MRFTHLLLSTALLIPLSGCTSDEEKALRFEEELATIVETNKDDCDAMAKALAALNADKGKDALALRAKLLPKKGAERKAFEEARQKKYGERITVIEKKLRAGMKCLLSSEAVATVMLELQDSGDPQPNRPAPARPVTGGPVTVVVDTVNPNSLDVSIYNFSDKTLAGFDMLIRYSKDDGSLVASPNGPSNGVRHWSISGASFRVPPNQWRSFVLDHLDAPAGATRAEIFVTRARALEGAKLNQTPVWEGDAFTWPGE